MPAIRPGPGPWTSIALRGFLSPLDQHIALEPGGRVAQRGLLGGFQLGVFGHALVQVFGFLPLQRGHTTPSGCPAPWDPPICIVTRQGPYIPPYPPLRGAVPVICAHSRPNPRTVQNCWEDLSSLKRVRYLSRTRPMDQNCTGGVPESTGPTHITETGR